MLRGTDRETAARTDESLLSVQINNYTRPSQEHCAPRRRQHNGGLFHRDTVEKYQPWKKKNHLTQIILQITVQFAIYFTKIKFTVNTFNTIKSINIWEETKKWTAKQMQGWREFQKVFKVVLARGSKSGGWDPSGVAWDWGGGVYFIQCLYKQL